MHFQVLLYIGFCFYSPNCKFRRVGMAADVKLAGMDLAIALRRINTQKYKIAFILVDN